MITRRNFVAQTAGFAIASLGGRAPAGPARAAPDRHHGLQERHLRLLRQVGGPSAAPTGSRRPCTTRRTWTRSRTRWACPQRCGPATPRSGPVPVEGHVPAGDLRRLLEERPAVAGLAVPGMPKSTPGHGRARASRPSRTRSCRSPGTARRRSSHATEPEGHRDGRGRHLSRGVARRRSSGSTASGSRPGSRSRRRTARRSATRRQDRRAGRPDLLRGGGRRGAGDVRRDPRIGRRARDRQDGGGARRRAGGAMAIC